MVQRLLIAAVAGVILTSCSGLKKMQKHDITTVTPIPMELIERNGSVDINYTITTNGKHIKKKEQIMFTPLLTDGVRDVVMTGVVINGKKFEKRELRAIKKGNHPASQDAIKIIALKKEPITATVDKVIPFEPWMVNAQLIGYTVLNDKKNKVFIKKELMADGIDYTPPIVIIEQPEEIKKIIVTDIEDHALIHFSINSAKIKPNLDANTLNMNNATKLINDVLANKTTKLNGITIVGISSPDGSFKFNNELSKERTAIVETYLLNNTNIKKDMIHTMNIAEDWNGLSKLLEATTLSDKNKLIEIIDSNKSDGEKNIALHKSPNFKEITNKLLPKLRRTILHMSYTKTSIQKTIIIPIETIE